MKKRYSLNFRPVAACLLVATFMLSGVPGLVHASAVDAALEKLDREEGSGKNLLYYLDRGELLRSKGSFEDSRSAWLKADEQVRMWEESVKLDGAKILGDLGSYILNDSTRQYEGRDYEKVFLSVRLALDHLALGDWSAARTEIKKMHEREAVIAEFRSKEIEAAKQQAEAKGIKTNSFKELGGYPIETLEDPAVRSLKNAYESAYANYLAGFVYEALGEPSLAAAGYRKAAEMRPNDKLLEASLASLDKGNKGGKNSVDTLIIVESGNSPEITSTTLPILLPIIGRSGLSMVATPISWPVIQPASTSVVPESVSVNGKPMPLSLLTNVDHMARRALSDEMPGIIFRSGVRAITKGMAQKAIQDNFSGMFGAIASIAAGAAAITTEKADTRSWRTLPGFYSAGRISLPAGTVKITVQTPSGSESREIQVSGRHAVVVLRTGNDGLTLTQTPYVAAAPETAMPGAAENAVDTGKPTKLAKKKKN